MPSKLENSLKQRIVGALVLIALAVIFVPPFLKEKQQHPPFRSQIPAKPISLIDTEITKAAIEQNQQTQAELDQLDKQAAAPQETQPQKIVPQKIKTKQTGKQPSLAEAQAKQDEVASDQSGNSAKQNLDSVKQTLGSQFKDAGWIIQIASFSSKQNAINFVEKLKQQGHPAYRRKNLQSSETIYRIFVGPYVTKEKAQQAMEQVNKLSPSQGILQVFDPVRH